jgi:hypothetical protein
MHITNKLVFFFCLWLHTVYVSGYPYFSFVRSRPRPPLFITPDNRENTVPKTESVRRMLELTTSYFSDYCHCQNLGIFQHRKKKPVKFKHRLLNLITPVEFTKLYLKLSFILMGEHKWSIFGNTSRSTGNKSAGPRVSHHCYKLYRAKVRITAGRHHTELQCVFKFRHTYLSLHCCH